VQTPGVGARHFIFGAPVQIYSGGPLSCLYREYRGSFPEVRWRGRGLTLTTHPHLLPRLKKE